MIKRLIKLHLSFLNYVRKELKTKRTWDRFVIFLFNSIKGYFIALFREYKYNLNFLNPEFIKQKKQTKQYNQYKKDINNAWRIVAWMLKQGKNHKEMKQIRRDFEKYGKISQTLQKALLKDLYGVEG
jgi:hypothetical protein